MNYTIILSQSSCPGRRPVSLPIASVAKSFSVSNDASSAPGNNAGSGGCPDGGRREETQTDSAQVGGVEDVVQQCHARREKQERGETRSPARARRRSPPRGAIFDTIIMATEHDMVKSMTEQRASVQRASPGSGQGPHTGSTSDLGTGRTDLRAPEAVDGSGSGQRGDTDRVLETARRHEHGREVRSRQVLQGRSDVPIRTSSHHSGGRQVRRSRRSRERAATVGSSSQVRQSTIDPTVSRTPTVAGHPT